MTLPKISHPTFPLLIPSHRRAYQFRPFTVREEKILLMARESTGEDRYADWLRAVYQVVTNCLVSDSPVKLSTFDAEWLFLRLRAASVSPTVTQAFYDVEERESEGTVADPYEFQIDLNQVHAPEVPEDYIDGKLISTSDGQHSVLLQYPPATLFTDPEFSKATNELILFSSTLEVRTQTERFSTFTRPELIEYYDGWSSTDMERVQEFLSEIPQMSYKIEYKNKLGHDRSITLRGLSDFFTY